MPNRTQEDRLKAFPGMAESISLAKKLCYAMDTIKAEEQLESIQRNTPSIPEGEIVRPLGDVFISAAASLMPASVIVEVCRPQKISTPRPKFPLRTPHR